MITAEDVKKIKLFAPVPETELNSIAARAADVRLLTGEWLLYEGQPPSFFGLLEGQVEILKSPGGHEIRVGTYSPSDYFGEVPLLLDSPAIASIRAIEPSRVMRLERQDFRELVTHCRNAERGDFEYDDGARESHSSDDGRYSPGDGQGDRASPRRRVLSAP